MIAYALPHGSEIRLNLTPSPFGTHASAILFDKEARIRHETSGTVMYMDYCRPCIALRELDRMDAPETLRDLFPDWHPCECEPDDDADDDQL